MEKFPNLNLNQEEIKELENEKLEELREAEMGGVEKDEIMEAEMHDKLKHRKDESGAGLDKGEKAAELREAEMEGVEKDDYNEIVAKNYTEVFKHLDAEQIIEKENGEEIPELKEKFNEEVEKIKQLPEKEKKNLFEGIANLGYRTTEIRSRVMNWGFEKISKATKGNKLLYNYFNKYADIYKKNQERAIRQRKTVGKGKMSRVSGVGQGLGNLFKYGRAVWDAADQFSFKTFNPFRHATAASMFLGRSAEAAKETRLDYDSVKEKTRVGKEDDISLLNKVEAGEIAENDLSDEEKIKYDRAKKDMDRAWDEAHAIYEKAKTENKDGKINAKDLERAYKEQLPEDIQARFNRMEMVGTNAYQRFLAKDTKVYTNRLIKKIEKIDNSNASPEEKKIQKDNLLRKNDELLKDLDRMVGDAGLVDNIAYWSRFTEKTGKGVATALIIDSVARLASAASNIRYIFEKSDEDSEELYKVDYSKPARYHGAIPEDKIRTEEFDKFNEIYPKSDFQTEGSSITPGKVEDFDKGVVKLPTKSDIGPEGFFGEDAIIKKGEGIEHTLIRQLKENPKDFGFKGDIKNPAELNKWTGGEAHRLAIKGGYVDKATGEEIRVGTKGIDKAAYVLEKDADGKASIHEYFKGDDGKFKSIEEHELGKSKFEGSDKEAYEYTDSVDEAAKDGSVSSAEVSALSDEEIDKLAEARLNQGVENILGPENIENWDYIKDMPVKDVLAMEHGKPGENELWNLVKDAERTLGKPPAENQTIFDYLLENKKADIKLVEDVGEIPELVGDPVSALELQIEGMPPAFQKELVEIVDVKDFLSPKDERLRLEALIKQSDNSQKFMLRLSSFFRNKLGTGFNSTEQSRILDAVYDIKENNEDKGKQMEFLMDKINLIKKGVEGRGVIEKPIDATGGLEGVVKDSTGGQSKLVK